MFSRAQCEEVNSFFKSAVWRGEQFFSRAQCGEVNSVFKSAVWRGEQFFQERSVKR